MSSSPLLALIFFVLDAIIRCCTTVGDADSSKAALHTVRGSDSLEMAQLMSVLRLWMSEGS